MTLLSPASASNISAISPDFPARRYAPVYGEFVILYVEHYRTHAANTACIHDRTLLQIAEALVEAIRCGKVLSSKESDLMIIEVNREYQFMLCRRCWAGVTPNSDLNTRLKCEASLKPKR